MTCTKTRRLHLMVGNPEALEYGCRPSQEFGLTGGTIGGRGCTWPLSDRGGRIAQLHAEIVGVDGTFCLVDRSGLTSINGAVEPLGVDRIVRLADGDTMQVGPYRVDVRIGGEDDASETSEDRSLDSILASAGPALKTHPWQEAHGGYRTSSAPVVSDDWQVEPLLALDAAAIKPSVVDLIDGTHYGLSARHDVPPDRADTMVEAFWDRSSLGASTHAERDASPLDDRPRHEQTLWPGIVPPATRHAASTARDDIAEALQRRLAVLSEQDEASLCSVDETLRVILEAMTNEVVRSRMQTGAAEVAGDSAQIVETFWKTCERAFRHRIDGRDA